MFKTWTASHADAVALAEILEAYLNEFAEKVISVGYAVTDEQHQVMVVYQVLESAKDDRMEAAVTLAEDIVGQAQL